MIDEDMIDEEMFDEELIEQRQKLRKSMMGLLARREHSKLELFQKMQVRGYDAELINENLDEFVDKDWLSDKRYAKMLLRSRLLKSQGPLKINAELKQKGISGAIISKTLSADIDWKSIAFQALSKKFEKITTKQEYDPYSKQKTKQQSKQYRFLAQRGFTSEQIIWALKNH